MQTRKDLLQAHRLMTQRAALALMLGEPDNPELPMRRLNVGLICGVMVTVLVAAVFGIWGLLRPGGAEVLRKAGTLVIAKDNGTRYVWCQNGKLCPVANYSSARLMAGGEQKLVFSGSLAAFERGPMIGIPGAPDTVPAPDRLTKTPWSVCVRAVDSALSGRTSMVTLIAGRDVGGQPLRDDQALVVSANGQPWLIWKDRRLRVPPATVGALTANPTPVSGKWLNALPPAADFKAPEIAGRGEDAPGPQGNNKVGQVFTVDAAAGADAAWYVLSGDGLARITETEGRLLLADPRSKLAYPGQAVGPVRIDPATAASAKPSAQNISNRALPPRPPRIEPYSDATPLCAIYDDPTGKRGARLSLGGQLPGPPDTPGGANAADQLVLPPGGGTLAGVLPGPGKAAAVNTYFLVTEGKRFALQSPEAASKLGYNLKDDSVPIPASILGLIPNGPALDPGAAPTPISAPGQTGGQADGPPG